jgi:hypothetical protein
VNGKAVISLTAGLEDAEKVTVAFLVAVAAAEQQQPTLMFLTKEAVRLALEGVAQGVACAGCPPLPDLTKRYHDASTSQQVAEEIILGRWFGPGDDIEELCSVSTGRVAEREHVTYQMRVRRAGRGYLVEQHAYYDTDGPRITWMRVLCSGYQLAQGRPGRGG